MHDHAHIFVIFQVAFEKKGVEHAGSVAAKKVWQVIPTCI